MVRVVAVAAVCFTDILERGTQETTSLKQ